MYQKGGFGIAKKFLNSRYRAFLTSFWAFFWQKFKDRKKAEAWIDTGQSLRRSRRFFGFPLYKKFL